MQKALLAPIRQDLLREAERLREQVERLRERLAVIDTAVKGLDAAISLDFGDVQEPGRTGEAATQRPGIKQSVIREATSCTGEITAPELYDDLRAREEFADDKRLSKSVVSHALREAAETGELVLIEKGAGSRAARYRSAQVGLDLGDLKTEAEPPAGDSAS
ncbi:MAG: hypothetical protein WAM82_00965 [Thermoanaerobaculia bacterium]